MTTPQFIQLYQHNAAAVAQELLQGLSAPQAFTSHKYLYDALGNPGKKRIVINATFTIGMLV